VKEGEAFSNGEWGAEICDMMKPREGDLIVKGKSGLCGFQSTNLDFLLRQNDIKNVVLAGFLTNCCVESSMRTAYEYGYRVSRKSGSMENVWLFRTEHWLQIAVFLFLHRSTR
jgi:nicotinamidase-related amidase